MRRLNRNEHGATTVIVAILVPVILLGLGALVISVGGWYASRGMDQNAADAAAIAVANTCQSGTCDQSVAAQYANGSNNGGLAGYVAVVCGRGPTKASGAQVPANFANCDYSTYPTSPMCPAAPANANAGYVNVVIRPGTSVASKDFLGGGSTAVSACAQATISPAGGCTGCAALTISKCEWDQNTATGTNYAPLPAGSGSAASHYDVGAPHYTQPPTFYDTFTARRADQSHYPGFNFYDPRFPSGNPQPSPDPSKIGPPQDPNYNRAWPAPSSPVDGAETVITTHGTNGSCGATGGSPGAFGWLSNSSCSVLIPGTTYGPGATPSTGNGTGNNPAPCEAVFANSRDNATPIYLPVYSNVTGSGNNTVYTLAGFAAFVVTGWDVGNGGGSWGTRVAQSRVAQADTGLASIRPRVTTDYCGAYTGSPSDICIFGYFTAPLAPPGSLIGGGTGSTDVFAVSLSG